MRAGSAPSCAACASGGDSRSTHTGGTTPRPHANKALQLTFLGAFQLGFGSLLSSTAGSGSASEALLAAAEQLIRQADSNSVLSFYVVIAACLILGTGHVGWGIIHPFRELKDSDAGLVVRASLHACWYHITVIFYSTAGVLAWHMGIEAVSLQVMALLWILILFCWFCYLGALLAFPQFWRIAWFQMVLIVILLLCFAHGILAIDAGT